MCKKSSRNLMSVFVQQTGTECEFSGSDSWVILSPIEQSIKRKIEAVGTPLKDWDINIYRGVLTGYNEALSYQRKNEKRFLPTASPKTSASGRLNLYDRFCEAEISRDMDIIGQTCG